MRITDYFIDKSFLSLTASQVLSLGSCVLGSSVLGSRVSESQVSGSKVLILDYALFSTSKSSFLYRCSQTLIPMKLI